MDDHPLLSIRNLTVSKGQVRLVEGVSLDLEKSRTHGLVGESGSGKSVSAMAALRLFDPRQFNISADRLSLAGRDLLSLPEREMRRIRGAQISMVFQEPMSALNPLLTVGEQIVETLCIHQRLTRRAARARAVEMLEWVRIPAPEQRLDEYPNLLSGGMRQRVLIAIALACRPQLLIADEPTTALDVTIQAQILELLHELQAHLEMAILLISHDLGVVAGYAENVSVMYAGRIVESGTVDQIFEAPRHPYTAGLIASHPPVDEDLDELPTIAGTVPQPHQRPMGCRFGPRCQYRRPACEARDPPLITFPDGQAAACIRETGYRPPSVADCPAQSMEVWPCR